MPRVIGPTIDAVQVSTVLDPYMSLAAAAAYTGLSRRTLRSFIDLAPEQALPAYRLAGKILLRRSDIDRFLKQYWSRGRPSLVRAIAEMGLDTA